MRFSESQCTTLLMCYVLSSCSLDNQRDVATAIVPVPTSCTEEATAFVKGPQKTGITSQLAAFTQQPDEAFGLYGVLTIEDSSARTFQSNIGEIRYVDTLAGSVLSACSANQSMTMQLSDWPETSDPDGFLRSIVGSKAVLTPNAKVSNGEITFFYRVPEANPDQ